MVKLWSYVIRDDRCRRCGRCVAVCPTDAISVPQGKVVTTTYGQAAIDSRRCNACGACVESCKLRAISKKFEPRF